MAHSIVLMHLFSVLQNKMPVKIGDVARHLGVSVQTVRDWTTKRKLKCTTTIGGTRLYDLEDLYTNLCEKVVFYCRVPFIKRQDELEQQAKRAREICPEAEIIKEIGSGFDWERERFRELFQRAARGELSEIKVFHRDQLCQSGFEIIEQVFYMFNVRISIVNDSTADSSNQENESLSWNFPLETTRRKHEIDEAKDIQIRQNPAKELNENDGTCEKNLQSRA